MFFIVDDAEHRKRGKHMEAVGWVRDPVTGKSVRGHVYVAAVVTIRGAIFPWGIRLYAKKEHCRQLGISFAKTTELAAELIESFTPPPGVKVTVLFDSYYLCKTVANVCRAKGFRFASTPKANRDLFRGGRKLKAGSYSGRAYRRGQKKSLRVGKATYRLVDTAWMEPAYWAWQGCCAGMSQMPVAQSWDTER